jgi:flagellin
MNAHRWLGVADSSLNKSLERLSSGYRINRAADDAAGLAISESFRAGIASFKVASRNTSEASSMLQVAEGGMDQIGNMLTRLKELATQAASANVGSSERAKIDSEADQLITEIDRLADSAKYGSTKLLDGNFGVTQTTQVDAGTAGDGMVGSTNVVYDLEGVNAGTTVDTLGNSVAEATKFYLTMTAADGGKVYLANSAGTVQEKFTYTDTSQSVVTFTNLGIQITFTGAISDAGILVATAAYCTGGSDYVEFTRTGLTSLTANNAATGTYTISDTGDGNIKIYGPTMNESESFVAYGQTITFDQLNISFNLSSDWAQTGGELNNMTFTVGTNSSAVGSTFQIGAENNSDNQISITIDGVGTVDLGINTIDLSTSDGAQSALDSIDTAISNLASSRGNVGAYMNRLSYAAANLASTIENVQAAESVIRDVDMAAEMTTFTKNQILLQSGTAMLAQANMAPQIVLQLLG